MVEHETDISTDRYTTDLRPVVEFLSYLRLPNETFPTLYTEAYYQWKIADNPFGESACYLRRRGRVPVAHTSITAKPMNPWLGVGAGCGELGDSHTHPNFRRQGHFGAIGSHTIREFDQSNPPGAKLIYGLPNELALLGWIRQAGCEFFRELNIVELERSVWKTPFSATRAALAGALRAMQPASARLLHCTDDTQTAAEIDRLWSDAHEKETYLLKKDGAWWQWRYTRSTETYQTYALREQHSDRLLAYVVTKVSWRRLRHVQLCEIFGETSERAAEAFHLFMQTVALSFDTLVLWAQTDTKLADAAMCQGFAKRRDVPVIFFKNEAYAQLRNRDNRIQLALGDTDNV